MFKTFGTETLLSEDLNGIMRQTVIRVSNSAELNALTPVDDGMLAYREDNGTYYRRSSPFWVPLIESDDLGWQPLTLSPEVVAYNAGQAPHYLVRGGMVTIAGAVKPANASAATAINGAGGAGINIVDLEANGIKPQSGGGLLLTALHQGSALDHWTSQYSGTAVRANRYTGTASTSTWMPFHLTYPIERSIG